MCVGLLVPRVSIERSVGVYITNHSRRITTIMLVLGISMSTCRETSFIVSSTYHGNFENSDATGLVLRRKGVPTSSCMIYKTRSGTKSLDKAAGTAVQCCVLPTRNLFRCGQHWLHHPQRILGSKTFQGTLFEYWFMENPTLKHNNKKYKWLTT